MPETEFGSDQPKGRENNLPQLRTDLSVDQVADIAKGFGALTALQSTAPSGSLRGAPTAAGISAVVMKIGCPLNLEPEKVVVGVNSFRTFLKVVGMMETFKFLPTPQPVFYGSEWGRAEAGGILINKIKLGASVEKGDALAEVIDPGTNVVHQTVSYL